MKNNSKTKEQEPLRLWFNFTQSAYGGEAMSEEQFADRTDEYREVSFHGCFRNGPDGLMFDNTSVEVSKHVYDAEKVLLVVVRFQDGDTFGTSYGNWEIVDVVLTMGEAEEIRRNIDAGEYTHKNGYNPWEGYFNQLEAVEIHEFAVQEQVPGKVKQVLSRIIKH